MQSSNTEPTDDTNDEQGSIRTLLVDDSKVVLELLAYLLAGSNGVEIIGKVDNAAVAQVAAENLQPDLIIMDLGLPGGVKTLPALKAITPVPRIVLTSVRADDQELTRVALEAGADGYCNKMRIVSDLLPLVRSLFPKRAGQGRGSV